MIALQPLRISLPVSSLKPRFVKAGFPLAGVGASETLFSGAVAFFRLHAKCIYLAIYCLSACIMKAKDG
jgi:hypothetical protein